MREEAVQLNEMAFESMQCIRKEGFQKVYRVPPLADMILFLHAFGFVLILSKMQMLQRLLLHYVCWSLRFMVLAAVAETAKLGAARWGYGSLL